MVHALKFSRLYYYGVVGLRVCTLKPVTEHITTKVDSMGQNILMSRGHKMLTA